MENAGVKCWSLSRLCDNSSRTTQGKEGKYIAPPYLLRNQEDTGFYLSVLAFRTSSKVYALRRGFGECQTEVKGRMQGGQNIWNDVHLMNPFHLNTVRMGVPSQGDTTHQEVEVSVVPPLLLSEVPVNGFGHVR